MNYMHKNNNKNNNYYNNNNKNKSYVNLMHKCMYICEYDAYICMYMK